MAQALPSFISRQVQDASYFFLNLSSRPTTGLEVSCGGMEKCAPDYRLKRSAFDYVGIEYVVAGRARVWIGEQEFELRPGSLFGYTPDTTLVIENSGVYPLTKCFVDLHGDRAHRLFRESPLGKLRVLDFAGVRWIEETFRQMLKFGERGGQKAERSCELLAELLLLQLEESQREQGGGESTGYLSYQRCREVMERDFTELRSIADLAERVSLDQAYISRLFRKHANEAPYRMLVRLKMNWAARLMMRENLPVKAAAIEVGFEDAAHFSRVFKQTFGVSPAQFAGSLQR